MSDTIVLNDPDLGRQIAKTAGTGFNPGSSISVARVKDGELLGGVVYNDYTGESMGIHVAAYEDHWLNRDLLYVVFDYPFRQLGVKRLFSQMPEDNKVALHFNKRLGFEYVTRVEGVFRNNVACILTKMEATNCRYLSIKPQRVIARKIN